MDRDNDACSSCKLLPGGNNHYELQIELDGLSAIYGPLLKLGRDDDTGIVSLSVALESIPGARVHLSIDENTYPSAPPVLRIDAADFTKKQVTEMTRAAAAENEFVDLFSLISATESLLVEAQEAGNEVKRDATHSKEEDGSNTSHVARLFRFHHIYSQKKRESMIAWGKQFGLLTTMIVIGKPGWLLVVGGANDVHQLVRQTRQLGWQSMALTAEYEFEHRITETPEDICIGEVTLDTLVAKMRSNGLDDFVSGMFS